MKLIQRKHPAVQLLVCMEELVDALPLSKRTKLIATLREIFSELENAAAAGAVCTRSAKKQ